MPTLAEIRSKFPMYSDVSDSQLLQGLHNKFYSDIPYEKFLGNIDFSGTKYDSGKVKSPTEGMSGPEKFNGAYGKAFYDIWQGCAQMVGSGESGQQTAYRKSLDAPLMATGPGLGGNVMGNVMAFAPLAAVPGANTIAGSGVIGATMAALQPYGSPIERIKNSALGGALGSALQTITRYPYETYNTIKSTVSAPFKAVGAAIEPFYESGRDKIVSRAINTAIGSQAQME